MKFIDEMTEQEILALTEEDIQKLIKLRMMQKGIRIMDKPKVPELFEVEPADLKVYKIPFLEGYAFTDMKEAQAISDALSKTKTIKRVNYDWSKLGSDYKYLEDIKREDYNSDDKFGIKTGLAYSTELYAKISDFAAQNKAMKEQAEKDQKEYDEHMKQASDIITECRERVSEVRNKYDRLQTLTQKFAADYYPLSDNNEDMAMKFMVKAYSLNEEEKAYILTNYTEHLPKSKEE